MQKPSPPDSEPDPEGWSRFERAVDVVFRAAPQNKPKAKAAEPKASKAKTAKRP